MATTKAKHALNFKIIAECTTTKARVSKMELPHHVVDTPVFMPVGTQGTLKGLVPDQLKELDCKIMLGNTYHLGHRPGPELLDKAGGLHKFMNWDRCLLTDSGGFQMVSLLKLAEITEEGVKFESPHDGSEMMLTPEKSIEIQNAIGADIMMQLDDVVHSTTTGPRVEEAMYRSIRWLDRCLKANKRPEDQNLFPIIQGGLDVTLREKCAQEMIKRDVAGFAIGGLSGGEEKSQFWRMVDISTDHLPRDKPRYLMGVGFAEDLVVCVALGCDMFDCVFPTRTARQKLSPDFWIEAGLDPDGFKKKFISRYKGFGVFSQKKSKTGDFLLEYEGELLRGQNIQGRQLQHEVSNQRRERRGGIPRCFMFHFKYNGKKMCLDATYSRERLGHFVNDAKKNQTSCNAKMKLRTYKHRPRLLLFGTQDVAIGEEISFDYGDDNNLWWRKEGAEEYSSESDSEVPRKRAKLPKKKWTLEEKAALRKLVDKATIEQKPPRKAEIQKRFGNALVPTGSLELKKKIFADDYRPIDESCKCCTCRQYTRAYLHTVVQSETVACQLVSVHNVAYQLELMRSVRQSIVEGRFPEFIQKFFKTLHPDGKYPKWAVEALEKVNVKLVCQLVQNGVKSESECLET